MHRHTIAFAFAIAGCSTTELSTLSQAINDPPPTSPGMHDLPFEVSNGDERAYKLYLPAGYTQNVGGPFPMLAMFHGGGQSAQSFSERPGMLRLQAVVDTNTYVVVYLQGRLGDEVDLPGLWDPTGTVRDDALYTQELLDHLGTELNVDTGRVFAAGYSFGGLMVHTLGATDPTRYAGIGAVETAYGWDAPAYAPPSPPVGTTMPLFMVHQDEDPVVPYDGGQGDDGTGPSWLSTEDTFEAWSINNGCTTVIGTTVTVDMVILGSACTPNSGRTVMQFVTLFDDTHAWPSLQQGHAYDTSGELIAFFDQL